MAEATVFVDDAVQGTMPFVCAVDGGEADGHFRLTTEVGSSNRLGLLWLLLLAGPLGWLIFLFLAGRDGGERLTVRLPFGEAAFERYAGAKRLRNRSLLAALGAAVAGYALSLLVGPGPGVAAVLVLGAAVTVAALVAAAVGAWRTRMTVPHVDLDASRRWVTLTRVSPAFAEACAAARERAGAVTIFAVLAL